MITELLRKVIQQWEDTFSSALFSGDEGDHTLDMTMTSDDMALSCLRWMVVWSRGSDPRRVFFRRFSGWVPALGVRHWDFVKGSVQLATNDYEWHQTVELRPEHSGNPWAYEAIVSILTGEDVVSWNGRVRDSVTLL